MCETAIESSRERCGIVYRLGIFCMPSAKLHLGQCRLTSGVPLVRFSFDFLEYLPVAIENECGRTADGK